MIGNVHCQDCHTDYREACKTVWMHSDDWDKKNPLGDIESDERLVTVAARGCPRAEQALRDRLAELRESAREAGHNRAADHINEWLLDEES